MNRIYFIRHAENLANLTKEFSYKKVDYSLTPKGVLQAQQTADHFKNIPIDEIYSSPLKRAQETAEPIARQKALPVKVLEAFREINVGTLEDRPPTAESWALHNHILNSWVSGDHDMRFPKGENYHEVLARMVDGFKQITAGKDGKQIIVIGHGGIFTYTVEMLCKNVDLREIFSNQLYNCAISTIDANHVPDGLEMHLRKWAAFSHLHGEAAQFVKPYVSQEEIEQGEIVK